MRVFVSNDYVKLMINIQKWSLNGCVLVAQIKNAFHFHQLVFLFEWVHLLDVYTEVFRGYSYVLL